MKLTLVVALLGALGCFLATPGALNAQESPKLQEMVGRFVRIQTVKQGQGTIILMLFTPGGGGDPITFVIPSRTSDGKPAGEDETMRKHIEHLVSSCKVGEYYSIQYNIQNNLHVLQGVAPYELTAMDKDPTIYSFVSIVPKRVGSADVTTINVSKLSKTFSFALPMVKVGTKMAPDPKMLETLTNLKKDQLVEIHATAGQLPVIKTIRPFEHPTMGEFVKVSKLENGLMAVEVAEGSGTVVLQIARKDSASLMGKARAFKSRDSVLYKYHQDEQGIWLTDIRPTPKDYIPPQREAKEEDFAGGRILYGKYVGTGRMKLLTGQEVDYVEILLDGGQMTQKMSVSKKNMDQVLGAVRGMKAGTDVSYRTIADLATEWITEVKPGKPAKEEEKVEKPSDGGNSGKPATEESK